MYRYFIHRGRPGDGWASFTGGSYGIPNRGYFQQGPAAVRAAESIAKIRRESVHVTRTYRLREGSEMRLISSVYAHFEFSPSRSR